MGKSNKETWKNHVNPDGSAGGLIGEHVRLGDNVTVAKTAIVVSESVVPENTTLEAGQIFTPDGIVQFSIK